MERVLLLDQKTEVLRFGSIKVDVFERLVDEEIGFKDIDVK